MPILLTDIKANATQTWMKTALENNFDLGFVKAERTGTCDAYSWTITFTSKGGTKPLLQVNGDKLQGNEVGISCSREEEGGVLQNPIPDEFLRILYPKPQVS